MSDADYPSWSSSLRSCLHPSLTSSVLGANILLSTLFSNTLISLNVRNPKPCSLKLLKFAHYSVFVGIFRMSIKYCGEIYLKKKQFRIFHTVNDSSKSKLYSRWNAEYCVFPDSSDNLIIFYASENPKITIYEGRSYINRPLSVASSEWTRPCAMVWWRVGTLLTSASDSLSSSDSWIQNERERDANNYCATCCNKVPNQRKRWAQINLE